MRARQLSLLEVDQRPALMSARASFDAGAHTRRTQGWRPSAVTPNSAVLGQLSTLRNRSRAAIANDGNAKGAIDKLVTNVIGTGIKPQSLSADPRFRERLHKLWLRWTDQSDADGLLDFYGQQTQLTRGWFEGGEMYARLRFRLPGDGLVVPLQVQLIEPELCPYSYNAQLSNGNKVRAGIEFDLIGRRVAYWFHPSRPGDLEDFDSARLVRVPADNVIHVYDPLRSGQLRGFPLLTTALVRLHELDKMDDATLLRQQLSNMFVGFLKRPASTEDPQIDPVTNEALSTYNNQADIALEPGAFHQLDEGEALEWSKPPDPSQTYPDFIRHQLRAVSTATGVPYEVLTGDMSSVNDRTVRVILHDFRRRIQQWQHQIIAFQFCRRVWSAWLFRAYLSGAIEVPANFLTAPEEWSQVKWVPQGWPYIHPVQDIAAAKDAIRNGLGSRAAAVAERGEDVEAIDAEQAADNARADSLGLKHDSDGRYPANQSITVVESDGGAQQGATR